jgi:uncharacterized damage-inducible protein DinB
MNPDDLKDHLLHQFRYNRHANEQILEALATHDTEDLPERALELMGHLLRAQDVWLGRVRGETDLPAIWGDDTLAECRERAEASAEAWRKFLEACPAEDLTRTVRYENSKGKPFENELREVCGHVVNHSTHHRAQIAMLIRQAGGEPPVTGYIFWARSNAVSADK